MKKSSTQFVGRVTLCLVLGVAVAVLTAGNAQAANELDAPTITVTTVYDDAPTDITNMAMRVSETGSYNQEWLRPTLAYRNLTIPVSGSDVNVEATLSMRWQDFPTNALGGLPSLIWRYWDVTVNSADDFGYGSASMSLSWAQYTNNAGQWVKATGTFTLPHLVWNNVDLEWVEVVNYNFAEGRSIQLYDGVSPFDGYVVDIDNITLRTTLPAGANLVNNGDFVSDVTGWQFQYGTPYWDEASLTSVFAEPIDLALGYYRFQEGIWNGRTINATSYDVDDAWTETSDVGINNTTLLTRRFISAPIVSHLRFDLSEVEQYQGRVGSATLTMTVAAWWDTGSATTTATHYVYSLPAGNTNWTEGTLTPSEQDTGIAWVDSDTNDLSGLFANYNAALDGTLNDTHAFPVGPAIGEQVVFDLDPDAVNEWLGNPAANAGLAILQSDVDPIYQFSYHSSEASAGASRPLLQMYVFPAGTLVTIR